MARAAGALAIDATLGTLTLLTSSWAGLLLEAPWGRRGVGAVGGALEKPRQTPDVRGQAHE